MLGAVFAFESATRARWIHTRGELSLESAARLDCAAGCVGLASKTECMARLCRFVNVRNAKGFISYNHKNEKMYERQDACKKNA